MQTLTKPTFRPILFNTTMVQAILDGRKTQTRRILKNNNSLYGAKFSNLDFETAVVDGLSSYDKYLITNYPLDDTFHRVFSSIETGDILWVRETTGITQAKELVYKADYSEKVNFQNMKWNPSIFMPKEACRIFLEVTDVRVERLNDISESDAISEGLDIVENENYGRMFRNYLLDPPSGFKVPELSFKTLWQSINGEESWDKNLWVWVYEFKRVDKPSGFW